jgi:hypothetical protein
VLTVVRLLRTFARVPLLQRWLYLASTALFLFGIHWGLPGNESWAPDAVSPRGVGLLAIAETFRTGHFHIYPPAHMALLTLLTSPITVSTLFKVGVVNAMTHPEVFEQIQTSKWAMTSIEIIARLVSVLMALGLVRNVAILFGGNLDGRRMRNLRSPMVIVLCISIAPLSYYAKVGNLDVPALFWASAALVSLRLERLRRFAIFAVISALTKDQAAGLLFLPLGAYVVVCCKRHGFAFWRSKLSDLQALKTVLLSVLGYGLLSGAIINPSGFRARLHLLFGPASQSWSPFPHTGAGTRALLLSIVQQLGGSSSFGLMLIALVSALLVAGGVLPARVRSQSVTKGRLRLVMPLLAALSFFLLFTLGARRSEARFLLPIAVFLAPYASYLLVDARLSLRQHALGLRGVALATMTLPGLLLAISVGATMVSDARYTMEKELAGLPSGATLTAIGGPKFLPRFPAHLRTVVPSTDPRAASPYLDHATRSFAPLSELNSRYVLLSAEFAHLSIGSGEVPFGVTEYTDSASQSFLQDLTQGMLPYRMIAHAECTLPWPLTCVEIHGSLGGNLWLYEREP